MKQSKTCKENQTKNKVSSSPEVTPKETNQGHANRNEQQQITIITKRNQTRNNHKHAN